MLSDVTFNNYVCDSASTFSSRQSEIDSYDVRPFIDHGLLFYLRTVADPGMGGVNPVMVP